MWFNKDNTIHFDVEEWSCTDIDAMQFCRKVSDTIFEYIQLKDGELHKFATNFHLNNKHLLETLNDKTTLNDWYQDEINVNDYDAEELAEYVAPFGGDDFLNAIKGCDKNQLMAECIFETDIMNGEYGYE